MLIEKKRHSAKYQDLLQKVKWLELSESLSKTGHWQVNLADNSLFWSDEVYKIHGVTKENYTPELSSAIKFYHPDDRARVEEYLQIAVANKEDFEFALRINAADGQTKYVHSKCALSLTDNGEVASIFGIFQDITEKKENERKLILAEQDVNTYIEAASDGYWDWHIKEDYEYMSPRFWQILGYDPKEKKHHPSEWQKLIFPEDLEKVLTNFECHLATQGQHPFEQEVRYRHKKGV